MDSLDVVVTWGKLLCGTTLPGVDVAAEFDGVGTLNKASHSTCAALHAWLHQNFSVPMDIQSAFVRSLYDARVKALQQCYKRATRKCKAEEFKQRILGLHDLAHLFVKCPVRAHLPQLMHMLRMMLWRNAGATVVAVAVTTMSNVLRLLLAAVQEEQPYLQT